MSKERALTTFRQEPWSYNCAQTVCAAYGREDLLAEMKQCGGGNAPDGLCGSLYGATCVLPDKREELVQFFREIMGAIHCRELKRQGKSCQDSVSTAADLIDELSPGRHF